MQLRTLQHGRGIAAIAIAAFHLSILLGLPRYLGNPVFYDVVKRGNLGVDFFFVLSGFIIAFVHNGDIGHPERVPLYLFKRFIRVFPIYWAYTIVFCTLLKLGFGGNGILPHTSTDWISTIFLVRLDGFELPITPGWTLMHELAFYFVFAILIANRTCGVVVLAIWLGIGGLVFQFADEGTRQPLTTYFSPLNFNFLVGMGAYYAWRHLRSPALIYALPVGLMLFAVVYALESSGVSYNLTQIPYAISFGLVIVGATTWERNGLPAFRFNVLALIGDASYSIYLTHLAFVGLYAKILIRLFGAHSAANAHLIYGADLLLTILSGCLLYRLVERPLLKASRTGLLRRPKRAAVPIEVRG